MSSPPSEHGSGHDRLSRSQEAGSAGGCWSSGPEAQPACILVLSWSGEGPEGLTSQGLGFSICKMGSQTGPLEEITACPETDPLLHERSSSTSLQQGQVGRVFKWYLVSNGAIIIMTVAVIAGAAAGVYQPFLSSCHFRQRPKASEKTAGAKHLPSREQMQSWV